MTPDRPRAWAPIASAWSHAKSNKLPHHAHFCYSRTRCHCTALHARTKNSSRSLMLAAAIATPVVFSACMLLILFFQPRYKRWIKQRIALRTQRDIEGKQAATDPDEHDPVTSPLDSATPLNAAGGVVSICPMSATTDTTTAMSPMSPKMPEMPTDCDSPSPQQQQQCAKAMPSASLVPPPPPPPPPTPDAKTSPPSSPSSRAPSRSSRNSRLRASVSVLVNRISNAARSPSAGSGHSGTRRGTGGRRRSRADPVLPRATPQFHFNADDMFAPRRRPPLPQRPQHPSVIIQRGRTTSPIPLPVPPQSPPPQSLLPPPPPPLALDPAPAPGPVSIPASRICRGVKSVGKTSRIRPLPPLPQFPWESCGAQSQSQSSLLSHQQHQQQPTSPMSSLRSLPPLQQQMSLVSALSPPPSRPHPLPPVPVSVPVSAPMSVPPPTATAMVDRIALQPNRLHQPEETAMVALAPLPSHDQRLLLPFGFRGRGDDPDPLPPPYTSHSRPS